jgi:hypothetical protein
MSDVRGLTADSPFVDLFGDLPISALLAYVHETWLAYADLYKSAKPPLQKRTEPQLTQALAAHLRERQVTGEQPFAGDFYGELSEYILDKTTGLPKCIARTDIEWRLHGVSGFIVEFKILDGKLQRREKYLLDGVMRFVAGRYSGAATAGAMFALLRKSASDDPKLILLELQKAGTDLRCAGVKIDSELLPKIAAFDSAHQRSAPHVTPPLPVCIPARNPRTPKPLR